MHPNAVGGALVVCAPSSNAHPQTVSLHCSMLPANAQKHLRCPPKPSQTRCDTCTLPVGMWPTGFGRCRKFHAPASRPALAGLWSVYTRPRFGHSMMLLALRLHRCHRVPSQIRNSLFRLRRSSTLLHSIPRSTLPKISQALLRMCQNRTPRLPRPAPLLLPGLTPRSTSVMRLSRASLSPLKNAVLCSEPNMVSKIIWQTKLSKAFLTKQQVAETESLLLE